LLVALGKTQVKGLQGVDGRGGKSRVDETAGESAEGTAATYEGCRILSYVANEDISAELPGVFTAEETDVVSDFVTAGKRGGREEPIAIEGPESGYIERRAVGIGAGCNEDVGVELSAEFVDGARGEGVEPVEKDGVITEVLNVAAGLSNKRADAFVGVADVGCVVTKADGIVVARAVVKTHEALVVAGAEGECTAITPEHFLHGRRRGKGCAELARGCGRGARREKVR